ncbi:hypothetical protein D3C81_2071640 [compost metagenome]
MVLPTSVFPLMVGVLSLVYSTPFASVLLEIVSICGVVGATVSTVMVYTGLVPLTLPAASTEETVRFSAPSATVGLVQVQVPLVTLTRSTSTPLL